MKLVNLTPHDICIHSSDSVLTVPPSGVVSRVKVEDGATQHILVDGNEVPLVATQVTCEIDPPLPSPIEHTLLIVSRTTAQVARGRDDLVIPHQTVRDADGEIIGCKALARMP